MTHPDRQCKSLKGESFAAYQSSHDLSETAKSHRQLHTREEGPALTIITPWRNFPSAQQIVEVVVHPAVSLGAEVIIVDDCSDSVPPEASARVFQEAGARYLRSETRVGPGAARNQGLELATGMAVAFLDADDEPDIGAIYQLATGAMTRGIDVLAGGFEKVEKRSSGVTYSRNHFPGVTMEFALADQPGIWRYLFRRAFLLEHGIRFPNLTYAEDLIFLLRAMRANPSYSHSRSLVYRYIVSDDERHLSHKAPSQEALHAVMNQLDPFLFDRTCPSTWRTSRAWAFRIMRRTLHESRGKGGIWMIKSATGGHRQAMQVGLGCLLFGWQRLASTKANLHERRGYARPCG